MTLPRLSNFYLIFLFVSFQVGFSQQINEAQFQKRKSINYYVLNPKFSHLDSVYMTIGKKEEVLKAGWIIIENKNGFSIQREIKNDTIIEIKTDSVIQVTRPWKIENIKILATENGKINLNPVLFLNSSDHKLNTIAYLKIPENDKIVLKHFHTKWSAITIPFSIRPSLKGQIRSQVTNEFKIGTAFSLNQDWEFYKNQRLEVKKNTYGLSFGLGFGLGRVELDNASTSLSNANYDNEEQGLILFLTPGVGVNIRGFKVLGFFGYDIGLTKNMNDWNYNKRPYLGIGFGFDFWTLKRNTN
jgi:hypothetical protein